MNQWTKHLSRSQFDTTEKYLDAVKAVEGVVNTSDAFRALLNGYLDNKLKELRETRPPLDAGYPYARAYQDGSENSIMLIQKLLGVDK